MHILNICLTYNRHKCLRRALRCFLDQDYEGEQTLLVYNTGEPVKDYDMGPPLPKNKHIILINSKKDFETGEEYECVGNKFKDVLTLIENLGSMLKADVDLVTHWDDDDVFLPYFNRLGVEGFQKAKEEGFEAYKTYFSYYRDEVGMHVESNNFEPSIFLDYQWIKDHPYSSTNVTFHDGWLKPLVKEKKLFIDRVQRPLFIYDWHPELKVFKMSGLPDTPENYQLSKQMSKDFCEEILVPNESNERWYKMIDNIV